MKYYHGFLLFLGIGIAFVFSGFAQQLAPGISAFKAPSDLPLPVSGYQVYLVGDAHGTVEPKTLFSAYMAKLHQHGLRDVFIEEDQVYQEDARAYTTWKTDVLPEGLCLRTDIIDVIRQFSRDLASERRVRIHLVDLDSPAAAIRAHLNQLKKALGAPASNLVIPEGAQFSKQAPELVDFMEGLTTDSEIINQLETVRYSLKAMAQGFEADTGPVRGFPGMEPREAGITNNVLYLLDKCSPGAALGFYGSVHVGKKPAALQVDGEAFWYRSLAVRLEEQGIKVFSAYTVPLVGSMRWRGEEVELDGRAVSFRVPDGRSMVDLMGEVPGRPIFYIDPSVAVNARAFFDSGRFDCVVVFRSATPMVDVCPRDGASSKR
jgi:hypothetical protein